MVGTDSDSTPPALDAAPSLDVPAFLPVPVTEGPALDTAAPTGNLSEIPVHDESVSDSPPTPVPASLGSPVLGGPVVGAFVDSSSAPIILPASLPPPVRLPTPPVVSPAQAPVPQLETTSSSDTAAKDVAATAELKDMVITSDGNDDDAASAYEDITIIDDAMYELVYYEEETVLDDLNGSSHHSHQSHSLAPQNVPGVGVTKEEPEGRFVQMEGMELLLANIRAKVPTAN